MAITEQVRAYAAEHGVDEGEAVELGLAEKAAEFAARGGEVYLEDPALGAGTT
jgi:phosphomethylpyrimidine synthase